MAETAKDIDGILDILRQGGLISPDETPTATPLTGGVSSDIWRIDLKSGPICVKRARAKLKVEDDWHAPVARNAFEVAWMQKAREIASNAAPEILFHDADAGLFAMRFLPNHRYPLWKAMLRDNHVRADDADAVGSILGRIHAATHTDPDIPARFASDDIFHAIRLEPYLLATAQRHPDLANRLHELVEITATTKTALVHGDVSPKNILIGPDGPVFLDAECAWFGDPAFDLAFCLNHLLLKCLWTPAGRPALRASFEALCEGYALETASIDDRDIMARAAHLLPGLFLARVDGKSPVEYITDDADKDLVRDVAKLFLTSPVAHPMDICQTWHARLGADR